MPKLIAMIISQFANGFLLGAGAALATVIAWPDSMPARVVGESVAGLFLILFAFGSTFGMGALATALWLDVDAD